MAVFTDTLDEGIGVSLQPQVGLSGQVSLVFQVISLLGVPVPDVMTERVNIKDSTRYGLSAALVDNTALGDPTLTYDFLPGALVAETMGISESALAGVRLVELSVEGVGVRETVRIGVPVNLSDTLALAYAVTAVRAIALVDRLGLAEVLLPGATFKLTQADTIRLADSLRRFFGGDVVDTVAISESLSRSGRLVRQATDNIGVAETLAKKLVVRVTAAETLELTHFDALKLLYGTTLTDGVEIAAAYISPGNSVTTWAVNTRNTATTEYTNFNFNSFAHIGNKYLGANSSGLYELDGNTDAGTNIVAAIKSGMMQIGGSRFSSFKAAYIGQRGTGDYVLKVETGDGKTYNYAVVGKNMQTSRVHFGKGLRARYFSFELISTGQDFDLDSIEFIPLVAQRRV